MDEGKFSFALGGEALRDHCLVLKVSQVVFRAVFRCTPLERDSLDLSLDFSRSEKFRTLVKEKRQHFIIHGHISK